MGSVEDPEGNIFSNQQEIVEAFPAYHLVSNNNHRRSHNTSPIGTSLTPYRTGNLDTVSEVSAALATTKSDSSPGPDRITYGLLKLIKDTNLRQVLLNDITRCVDNIPVPEKWSDMVMLMIPKPGKDKTKMKC